MFLYLYKHIFAILMDKNLRLAGHFICLTLLKENKQTLAKVVAPCYVLTHRARELYLSHISSRTGYFQLLILDILVKYVVVLFYKAKFDYLND